MKALLPKRFVAAFYERRTLSAVVDRRYRSVDSIQKSDKLRFSA